MSAEVQVVSAALFDGDKVLIVQRKNAPYQHCWSLPGGRIQADEDAVAAIRREIAEETGLRVETIFPVQKHRVASYSLQVFAAHADIDAAQAGDDAAALQCVSIHAPPDLRYTPDLWPIIGTAHQFLLTKL